MNQEEELTRAFELVFSGIPREHLSRLSTSSCAEWDSVTQLLLAGLVEERFGIRLDATEIATLTSFELLLDRVRATPNR